MRALALVGSWAVGTPRADSDVDVVLLTDSPSVYIEHDDWVAKVGGTRIVRTAAWGVITERRFALPSGLEVELGVGSPTWAAVTPVDEGTRRVVCHSMRALHDPDGLLAGLAAACGPQIRALDTGHAEGCDVVVASLPYHFGDPDGRRECQRAVRHSRGLVALDGDDVVGFATVELRGPACAELTWLAVKDDCRRSGIGTALVERLADELSRDGIRLLSVMTLADSADEERSSDSYAETRRFYTSRGFIRVCELEPVGWHFPAACMVRPLSRDSTVMALVRDHVSAFNARDIDRLVQGLSPTIVWRTGADVFTGLDEVRKVLDEAMAELTPSLEVRAVVSGGDQRVVAEMIERYSHHGVTHTAPIAAFFRFDGELITQVKVYREGSADP